MSPDYQPFTTVAGLYAHLTGRAVIKVGPHRTRYVLNAIHVWREDTWIVIFPSLIIMFTCCSLAEGGFETQIDAGEYNIVLT